MTATGEAGMMSGSRRPPGLTTSTSEDRETTPETTPETTLETTIESAGEYERDELETGL